MQTYPIPAASLARLQAAYAQFEQLVAVVAEAVGVDPGVKYHLDLQGQRFVVGDEAERTNHVAASAPDPGTDPAQT